MKRKVTIFNLFFDISQLRTIPIFDLTFFANFE